MCYLLWGDIRAGQLHYRTYSFFVIGASSSHNSQEVATISSPAHIIGRCLIPPPHVLVHFPQSPKRHLYWEGHGFVLHSFQANGGSSTQTKKKKNEFAEWLEQLVVYYLQIDCPGAQAPVVQRLDSAIQWKSTVQLIWSTTNWIMLWIVIYVMGSAIRSLNPWSHKSTSYPTDESSGLLLFFVLKQTPMLSRQIPLPHLATISFLCWESIACDTFCRWCTFE